ncbi:HD domain-containing protein 2 [Ameca splendens]|uniref:HD domain-containing protein 2 n=1 Tax=Ameca splendens TaxID=208324 RepID=A0ABV0ZAJ4_9TELE
MAAHIEKSAGMSNIMQFMKLIGQLKRVPRTGWVYRKVKNPESVSDHMYRMAMMSLTITDPTVDRDRCIKLALVHDMAECIVGDIAPSDNISKAEKHRREEEATRHLTSLLPEGLKQEIYALWEA